MNAIVVHYKELALKGKNRPWFIQLLVRQPEARARRAARARSMRSIDGPASRSSSGRDAPLGRGARRGSRRVFGIANFSRASAAPHDFEALASAILADIGDRRRRRRSACRRTRADKRLPFTSPQVEREDRRADQGSEGVARRPRSIPR